MATTKVKTIMLEDGDDMVVVPSSLSDDTPSPLPTEVAVKQSGAWKKWTFTNFVNYLKTVFPALNAASNSMTGNLEVLGNITAPNQTVTSDNDVLTRGTADDRYSRKNWRVIPLNSQPAWTNTTSGAGTSVENYPHGMMVISATTANFGAITSSTIGNRLSLGNFTSGGYGGVDFGKRMDIEFSANSWFNYNTTKQSWGVVLNPSTIVAGISGMTTAAGSYIAVVCDIGGGITLQVCNAGVKTTSSVLDTIASGFFQRLFLIENLGNGTVNLYINGVFSGSVSGAPTAQVGNNANKLHLCHTSNAVSATVSAAVGFTNVKISMEP